MNKIRHKTLWILRIVYVRYINYNNTCQAGRPERQKSSPVVTHRGTERRKSMYTEYGFEKDGIEYATVDEAYEDD